MNVYRCSDILDILILKHNVLELKGRAIESSLYLLCVLLCISVPVPTRFTVVL